MTCLSIGCVFFILRGINNQFFPTYIQNLIQATTADTIQLQQPKKTIIQQNVREQRNILEISDMMQDSIKNLQKRIISLDLSNTEPSQTSRQWIILTNDGLVLISKYQTGDQKTLFAKTHDDKTYTGTRYTLSSPYYDLLDLELWETLLDADTSFPSLQSLPNIWEIITGLQHENGEGKISWQINIISSTTGIRHETQFSSASPHTIYTRLNGDILWSNISWTTTTIFPITAQFVSSTIDEYNFLTWIYKENSILFNNYKLPFEISNQRANIWNTVFGRELAEDLYINNEEFIWSWSIITEINDININTTIDPETYWPLFKNQVKIDYNTNWQKKSATRINTEE